jgi:hypothetical protein
MSPFFQLLVFGLIFSSHEQAQNSVNLETAPVPLLLGGEKAPQLLNPEVRLFRLDELQQEDHFVSRIGDPRQAILQRRPLHRIPTVWNINWKPLARKFEIQSDTFFETGSLFVHLGEIESFLTRTPSEYLERLEVSERSPTASFSLSGLRFHFSEDENQIQRNQKVVYRLYRKDLMPPSLNRLSWVPLQIASDVKSRSDSLLQHPYWLTVGRHLEADQVFASYQIPKRRSEDLQNNFSLVVAIQFGDEEGQEFHRWSEESWAWSFPSEASRDLWAIRPGEYLLEKLVVSDDLGKKFFRAQFRISEESPWNSVISLQTEEALDVENSDQIRWEETPLELWDTDDLGRPVLPWTPHPQLMF